MGALTSMEADLALTLVLLDLVDSFCPLSVISFGVLYGCCIVGNRKTSLLSRMWLPDACGVVPEGPDVEHWNGLSECAEDPIDAWGRVEDVVLSLPLLGMSMPTSTEASCSLLGKKTMNVVAHPINISAAYIGAPSSGLKTLSVEINTVSSPLSTVPWTSLTAS